MVDAFEATNLLFKFSFTCQNIFLPPKGLKKKDLHLSTYLTKKSELNFCHFLNSFKNNFKQPNLKRALKPLYQSKTQTPKGT